MVDFLLIRAVQNGYELLGKGREFVTMFPCMEIFMHLGYKKLASWLMSWVSLKAFPHFPPRRVSQYPSQCFRSLEGLGERVGSCCHPGTVCSSAEAGAQRRRLARFLRAWLSTEESAAEGWNELVSCCSCDKQSSQHVSAKQEFFLCTLGTKRMQSREKWMWLQFNHLHPLVAYCPQPYILGAASWSGSLQHLNLTESLEEKQRFLERSFREGISM